MTDRGKSALIGCQGLMAIHRRRAIQVASLGGALPWLTGVAERLAMSAENTPASRPKSLLVLWCQGGPSQLETFDPHPGTKIGGEVRGIRTSLDGIQIADTMPAMAEHMHEVCLIRSMVSKEGDHERATYHLKTGWRPEPTVVHPSIGSILLHASPSNLEIPRHISILSSQWPARGGYLGPAFDAFKSSDPLAPVPNLTARVVENRMDKRMEFLELLEDEFQNGRIANLDTNRTLHRTTTLGAKTMMTSPQLTAFDVTLESDSTRQSFGDNPFGRSCLAAIRLLETGVRCVEVELAGWDSHINNHELQSKNARILDSALSAVLVELKQRDLFDDTIVLCGGEFGRTPRINAASGRDHWPHGFSLVLAGGRFRRGYVHGRTNPKPEAEQLEGASVRVEAKDWTEMPVTVSDLHATLLTSLGINPGEMQMTPIGRPLAWSKGDVLPELLDDRFE